MRRLWIGPARSGLRGVDEKGVQGTHLDRTHCNGKQTKPRSQARGAHVANLGSRLVVLEQVFQAGGTTVSWGLKNLCYGNIRANIGTE